LVRQNKLSSFKEKMVSWSKMTCLLWKPKIRHSVRKSLPLVSILSQQSESVPFHPVTINYVFIIQHSP